MATTERIDPPWEPPLAGTEIEHLAGLLRHLSLVEHHDFDADPDWEFRTALTDDADYLCRLYDESVVHARARLAAAWAVAS
ncbi:hypothetical protein [Branchiibius sp. NY16-3462-2]|uniref:hypothetical protein n=1 Tax=Branchiibius sp. NY16-3462-2 TaxID=1807500 RepID=UPI000798CA0A|nr:hypothetical protein [Branchiibius sp. NY16-3462-2]KYH46259.1 hypothetical protein AZH51_11635 [Branchiibius sp. NY16-3462-2]